MIQPCFLCGEATEYTLIGSAICDDVTGVYCVPLCTECEAIVEDDPSSLEEVKNEIARQISTCSNSVM